MKHLNYNSIYPFLCTSFLVLLSGLFANAQTLQPNVLTPLTPAVSTGLVFDASDCGGTLQPSCSNEVIDANLNNYYTFGTVLGVTVGGTLSVTDNLNIYNATVNTPYFVGFNITKASLVNLDLLGLLNGIMIRTKLGGNVVQFKSGPDLSVLGIGLLSATRANAGFLATEPFDEIEIICDISLLGENRIHYAFVQKFEASTTTLVCNTPEFQFAPNDPLYINSKKLGVGGLLDVNTGVTNADHVIDTDTANAALVYSLAAAATAVTLPVVNAIDEYADSTFAGFVIQKVNILNVNVLDQIEVRTYYKGNPVQSATGANNLASVSTGLLYGTEGKQTVGFVCTQPFDEVRLVFTPIVGVLNTVLVYNFIATKICPLSLACSDFIYLTKPATPAFVNMERTNIETACVGCQINDRDRVVNTDTADASEMILTAGLLGSMSISVLDPANEYPGGSYAGFVVESGTIGLLVLDLLDNIRITTYLNGIPRDNVSATSLLNLELLGLFGNQNVSKRAIVIPTTMSFDEIRISFGGLVNASVLSTLKVYYAFVETSTASDISLNCCPTIQVSPTAGSEQNVFLDRPILPFQAISQLIHPDGLQWVLFNTPQINDDMYTGGIVLGTSTAHLNSNLLSFTPNKSHFTSVGTYYLYLISTVPSLDATCRPFTEFKLHVMLTKQDIASGKKGVQISGILSTNDALPTGSDYTNGIVAHPENPDILILPNLQPNGNYTFTASLPGIYLFYIDVCDTSSPAVCNIEQLEIEIFDAPYIVKPPVANADVAIVTGHATTPTSVIIPIFNNDAAGNHGGTLGTSTIETHAQSGTTSIDGSGNLVYTPNAGFYGLDTVLYEVCETPSNMCDTTWVIVAVASPNALPGIHASDDYKESKQGITIDVLAPNGLIFNDFSTGANNLAVTPIVYSTPGEGTLTILQDGSYTFVPAPTFVGSRNYVYEVCDGPICAKATLHIVMIENVVIANPIVLLEGPYNTVSDLMSTHLSTNGANSILANNATVQPYAPIYGYNGTETVQASFFANHPNIVDWILIEIRDAATNTIVLGTRAGFVTSNGSVIDTNGLAGIVFKGIAPGSYLISIRHRNHLGAMLSLPVQLDHDFENQDFTGTVATYGSNARAEVETGVFALHMGNALTDAKLCFTGSQNDKAEIGIKANSAQVVTNTFVGYAKEDIDLNGVVSVSGSENDKQKLADKLGVAANLLTTIIEQLP